MRILKIEGQKIAFVAIPNENANTQAAFVAKNKDCILSDFNFIPGKNYKYVNGAVIADIATDNLQNIQNVSNICKDYLSKTDFIMLYDNPLSLSAADLTTVKTFRADCRIATDIVPAIPTVLAIILA